VKIARSVFISSSIFGIVIAVVYWISAHEPAGTLMLGLMAIGLTFAAGFMFLAQRDADLTGDKKDASKSGNWPHEDVGIYTTSTIWPFWTALSSCFMLIGLFWSPYVAAVAFAALLYSLFRLSLESNRNASAVDTRKARER
jgi:hypothetical protein